MKLAYQHMGSGSPIVILHGLFGSSDNWLTPAKKLAETNEVWLLDQRNHGDSPHDDEWTYNAMVEDLKEFIKDHSISKPTLIGHSMGGKTVMLFAIKYPELFKKLVVVDIGPKHYPPHHDSIISGLKSLELAVLKTRGQADKQLAAYVEEMGTRAFLLKNLNRKEEGGFEWKVNLTVISEQIENIGDELPGNETYDGPTLFISGRNSDYILPEDIGNIADRFPNRDVEIIDDAGHWVHAERPVEFLEAIDTFIKS